MADLVHARTDALFSPMSAMRGVEYALMKGKDAIVPTPFPHNAERMARLAPFCDMFTSYQLGLTSYESLNRGSAADLDAWGDAYGGKPRTSHEICIDGSYVDFGLEKMYPPDSPILKTGLFSEPRRVLAEKGLLDRADVYFRNSCEWMRRIRKFTFEKVRAADRVAGFDFLGDINTHWHTFGYSVGMMDEFYERPALQFRSRPAFRPRQRLQRACGRTEARGDLAFELRGRREGRASGPHPCRVQRKSRVERRAEGRRRAQRGGCAPRGI